jgi:hypothetical protein
MIRQEDEEEDKEDDEEDEEDEEHCFHLRPPPTYPGRLLIRECATFLPTAPGN